jgi:hypothetical protein
VIGKWKLTFVFTSIPAVLPLLASGLGALGIIGWRRKKNVSIAAA